MKNSLVIQTDIEKIRAMLSEEDRKQKERESNPNYHEIIIIDYLDLISPRKYLSNEQVKKQISNQSTQKIFFKR